MVYVEKMEDFLSEHWKGAGATGVLVSVLPSLATFNDIVGAVGASLGIVLLCLSIYAKYKEIKK